MPHETYFRIYVEEPFIYNNSPNPSLNNSLNPSLKKREVGALLPLFAKERAGSNPEPVEGESSFFKLIETN